MPKATKAKSAKQSVQSLDRAFGLLQLLADHPDGMTLAAIAPEADLAPSTAHRLLSSLEGLGFASFEASSNKWFVGLSAFRVGAAFLRRRDYVATARQFMRQLVELTGETSNLAVLKNDQLTFVSQIESSEAMRMAVPIGTRGPLHASAVGKAILAYLPQDEVADLVAKIDYPALTSKSHKNKTALLNDLKSIKSHGFAVDDEEQSLGLRCIAAPIFNELAEPIFAVSISGPTIRVSEDKLDHLAAHVVAVAKKISEQIGGVNRLDHEIV